MRLLAPLLIASLAACAPEGGEARAYVTPLAGQTAVPSDMPLVVRGGAREIPPDYEIGPVIRVLDRDDGGWIDGALTIDGEDLVFEPRLGWQSGRRYLWTVDPAAGVAHGPELPVPSHLVGTSAFATSDDLELLGSARADDGRACVVLSRPGSWSGGEQPRVTVNDLEIVDAAFVPLDASEWDPRLDLDPEDPYVDVYCLETAEPVGEGAVLRVWWDGGGPWHLVVDEAPVEDVIIGLHRGVLE